MQIQDERQRESVLHEWAIPLKRALTRQTEEPQTRFAIRARSESLEVEARDGGPGRRCSHLAAKTWIYLLADKIRRKGPVVAAFIGQWSASSRGVRMHIALLQSPLVAQHKKM